ncbi:hypothetical protein [Bacillus cereus]|uniref:hypothetical protein n=1 Tax=Bacillus cereus TaxID=1396 RepID=UPI0015BA12D4|nr:hypothetical protein [Bacillus cereus]
MKLKYMQNEDEDLIINTTLPDWKLFFIRNIGMSLLTEEQLWNHLLKKIINRHL